LEVTGQQIQIHSVGTLLTGWDSSDRRLVQQSLGVMSDYGVTYKVLTRSDNPEDFEGLSDRITSGYLLDGDAWLDPDQAVSVLRAALELRSVPLIDERIATATLLGVKVRLETGDAKFDFDSVLFTTGSSPLPSSLATIESVRPIRGVTVRLKGLDRFLKPMVRSYVRGRPFYLVGRSEGYCVIGASAEEKATPTIETGEFYRLLRDALDVVPALDTAAWLETRVGHRPVAPSGEPFFDAHLDQRWAWSSGHYRHGVTLAPLASEWAVSFVRDLQRAD
jgi:glycine oxidase